MSSPPCVVVVTQFVTHNPCEWITAPSTRGSQPQTRQCPSSQELRRHQPDHPPIRQEEDLHARHVHNDRLLDALGCQAQSVLNTSPGAHGYYDQQCNRSMDHSAALRQDTVDLIVP
ncbi:MAG: hypothetical protein ACRDR6_09825 [Pseudonocardiaceae bacterium]